MRSTITKDGSLRTSLVSLVAAASWLTGTGWWWWVKNGVNHFQRFISVPFWDTIRHRIRRALQEHLLLFSTKKKDYLVIFKWSFEDWIDHFLYISTTKYLHKNTLLKNFICPSIWIFFYICFVVYLDRYHVKYLK